MNLGKINFFQLPFKCKYDNLDDLSLTVDRNVAI